MIKYIRLEVMLRMKNLTKKLSALVACTVFATMQIASAAGLSNASINSTEGGYAGMDVGTNSATLKFTDNAHVRWNDLNVNSNETLNFNAINGATGLTVLNTVTGGNMTQIYGTVKANSGISRLIISNPNGMLFDGANFTTAGDLMLTTQALNATFNGNNMNITGLNQTAVEGVTIKNSDFTVGGEFNITAPSINAIQATVKADNGFKLITRDGQNYLVSAVSGTTANDGVRLESVSVNGNVYITAGKDVTKIVNGGNIDGDLKIDSNGIVSLNVMNNNETLEVTGDVNVNTDGGMIFMYDGHKNANPVFLRKANVGGNVDISNSGGYVDIMDVNVTGNAKLTTTAGANPKYKHYVHVAGNNDIQGNLEINSEHNIHIGGYDTALQQFVPGSLKVGKTLDAHAKDGSVTITLNTQADKVNLTSDSLNILTDSISTITANEYNFNANHYIGAVNSNAELIDTMENYKQLPTVDNYDYLKIAGGDIKAIKTGADGKAYIKSNNDVTVNGVNAGKVYLTATNPTDALGGTITIKDDVHADTIKVGGETKEIKLNLASRDYTLNYVNIKDTAETVIAPTTEITYEMMEQNPGYNNGVQTANNTIIKITAPVTPSGPDEPRIVTPDDNDNVKILNNLNRDPIAKAIDMGQPLTPIAFAADLDDQIDTGVRKNVDGSVTVVRPFTPTK